MRFFRPVTRPIAIAPEGNMALLPTERPEIPQELMPILVPVGGDGSSVILVLRGIAGIGKSCLARVIYQWCLAHGLTCVVCNADVWFVDHDNTYHWNREGLTNAHDHCHGRFMMGMALRNEVIIVDNTNLRPGDYQWYLDHFDLDNYELHVVEIECASERVARSATTRATRLGHLGPGYNAEEKFRLFHQHRDPDAIVIQPTFPLLGDVAHAIATGIEAAQRD